MIRYLNQEEKVRSKAIWNEAFPEDSKQFVDYYYVEKTKDNQILVKELEGELVAMLHMNPYQIKVRNQQYGLHYIVGVATKEANRHQGHMRDLLMRMLQDMYRVGEAFCFLMPANPKIYLPFDFAYIFDQPKWKLNDNTALTKVRYEESVEGDMPSWSELAAWQNAWLEARYELFAHRDRAYMERLFREMESEKGFWQLLYREKEWVGMQGFWGIEKVEQRFLFAKEGLMEQEGEAKPAIMARIVNLSKFFCLLSLKPESEEEEITVKLSVEDSLIHANQGSYQLRLDKHGVVVQPLESEDDDEKIPIAQLTGMLFGYQGADCLMMSYPKTAAWLQKVSLPSPVYLDEIV